MSEITNQYEIPIPEPIEWALTSSGGNSIVSQGNLQSGNYSANSGYQFTPNGDAILNNAFIRGKITATAGGVIGGFDIGADFIRDTGNSFGLSSAITTWDDIRFWAGATLANFASAPLRVTEAWAIYASSADVTGKITATSGAISSWTVNAQELSSANNKIKLQATAERILVGDATAPLTWVGVFIGKDWTDYEFRVWDPSAKYIHFDGTTGFTMNGIYFSQAVLASLSTGTELSVLGWQFDWTFSATDYNTVAWTAGTLTFSDGSHYHIDAGNTWDITALTYIYFSLLASETVMQKATTYVAWAGKVLIATATPNALTTSKATYQVYGGNGWLFVNWVNIADGSIDLTKFGYWLTPVEVFDILPTTGNFEWRMVFLTTDKKLYRYDGSNFIKTIDPADLSWSVWLDKTNIAAQWWTSTCVFSASDSDTVAWAAWAITTAAWVSYSIDAWNTGNMSAVTYVYLDTAVSATVLQTTTTATTAIGSGKILLATANKVTDATKKAEFQVFSGIGWIWKLFTADNIAANAITANEIAANTITASQIAANTITASEIAANTITAGQIASATITASEIAANTITASQIAAGTITASQIAASTITANEIAGNTITANKLTVAQLASIAADLGSITAGNITLNSSWFIKGGQTDYNTGTGFYLGYNTTWDDAYKFSVGDQPNDKYFAYDWAEIAVHTPTIRIWNLNWFLDYSTDIYGIAIGDSNSYLKYDPTNWLRVEGTASYYIITASANVKNSANTERTHTGDTNATKVKEFQVYHDWTYRVYFDAKVSQYSNANSIAFYKNGVYQSEAAEPTTDYTTYSFDATVVLGDLIQIYIINNSSVYTGYVKNAKLAYDRTYKLDSYVNTD